MRRLTADANSTTMRLNNLARNRKPKTRAMLLTPRTRRVSLIESIKQMRQRFARDARA